MNRTEDYIRAKHDAEQNGHGDSYEDPRDRKYKPKVEIIMADDLLKKTLPAARWAVEGLIPEGMTFLCGRPKIGKSWLALQTAIAVASGGVALGSIHCEAATVLYLALEDTQRRLQSRLRKLLGDFPAPSRLHLATAWPRQDQGGIIALDQWLADHRDCRTVFIDTWQKFRAPKLRGDDYGQDTAHAAEVKAIGDKYAVGIVPLHHTRKAESSDPLDSVSGTLGLTGAADGVLILTKERGQHDATLFVSGRDVEEREIALSWDAACCSWSTMGTADEYRMSKARGEIMRVLREAGRPMKPAEVAPLIDKKPNAVKLTMWRLEKDGWLTAEGDGSYSVSSSNTSN